MQGIQILFCLFVPDDLAKGIQSVELCWKGKLKYPKELRRKGTMWIKTLIFTETDDEFEYYYKLQIKKSYAIFLSKTDEILDLQKRYVCWGHIQRDIISITTKTFQEEDKAKGIVAHIDDILLQPNYKVTTAFDELDKLMSRNILKSSHWNSAFEQLLDRPVTEKMCLLLLHCIWKKYVPGVLSRRRYTASKIWEQLLHLDEELKGICVQFVAEIFQIYEALNTSQCSPLHIINDMQSILDISSLHKLLQSKSSYPYHSCGKSQPCLQNALKFILSQDEDCHMLYDMVCLIFSYIPETEVLEGFAILANFNATDKMQELKNMAQKHIVGKIEKILAVKVRCFNFKEVSDIVSKADDYQRLGFVQLCEMEMLACIENLGSYRPGFKWKDLEHFCNKEKMFQTMDKKILLLEAVLKMSSLVPSRDFIKYVLMDFQNLDSTNAKETLEKAFDVLIDTLPGTSSEALKSCFEEYDILAEKMFFQGIREHIEKRLQLYISKCPVSNILKIHADAEKLHSATIDFYCQQLKERLKTQTLNKRLEFLKIHWKNLDTRYYIENSYK